MWYTDPGEYRPRFQWINPKSIELLREIFEEARTIKNEIVGFNEITNELIRHLPSDARKMMMGIIL